MFSFIYIVENLSMVVALLFVVVVVTVCGVCCVMHSVGYHTI